MAPGEGWVVADGKVKGREKRLSDGLGGRTLSWISFWLSGVVPGARPRAGGAGGPVDELAVPLEPRDRALSLKRIDIMTIFVVLFHLTS